MPAELNFKVVVSSKDGKSYQKEMTGEAGEFLMRKRIGETLKGDALGFEGYELQVTGGSDKAGFPMRKGIQAPRKRIMIGASVGFSGKKRKTKKDKNRKQAGLQKRRTVCGEMVTIKTAQVNLKVVKAGAKALGEAPAEAAAEEAPKAE